MKKKKVNPIFDLRKFSADILAKRIKDDLSFGEVERTVGIKKAMLHAMEKGETYPNVRTFAIVLHWLGKEPKTYFINK